MEKRKGDYIAKQSKADIQWNCFIGYQKCVGLELENNIATVHYVQEDFVKNEANFHILIALFSEFIQEQEIKTFKAHSFLKQDWFCFTMNNIINK